MDRQELNERINEFAKCHPEFYHRCKPLVHPLLEYFIEFFDVNINPDDMPPHPDFETDQQKEIRFAAVLRLMCEFRATDPAFDFDYDLRFDIFTTVIYWYLKHRSADKTWEMKNNQIPTVKNVYVPQIVPRPQNVELEFRRGQVLASYRPAVLPDLPEQRVSGPPGDFYGESRENIENPRAHDPTHPPQWWLQQQSGDGEKSNNDIDEAMNSDPEPKVPEIEEEGPAKDAADPIGGQQDRADIADLGTAEETTVNWRNMFSAINEFPNLSEDFIKTACESRGPVDIPSRFTSRLGKVPHTEILELVFKETKIRYAHRYSKFLASEKGVNAKELLNNALNPRLAELFNRGINNLEDLKSISGNPETLHKPRIYLHVLVDLSTGQFWLYAGQAIDMKLRISDHNAPAYRKGQSSCHCHVWDTLLATTSIASFFLKLASFPEYPPPHNPPSYELNLSEMWMACCFQTLREKDLAIYLPPELPRPWAGMHLNVALPLWQKFPDERGPLDTNTDGEGVDRQTFKDCLFSSDPKIKKWAETLRDSYHALQGSPSRLLREYYLEQRRALSRRALAAIRTKSYAKCQEFLTGLETTVSEKAHGLRFNVQRFGIYIASGLNFPIEEDRKLPFIAQCFLMDGPHPLRYAQSKPLNEPSSRLLISVRNVGGAAKEFMGGCTPMGWS